MRKSNTGLSSHFLKIVDEFLANPNQAIGQVNLLSEIEQQRLIVDFNQTNTPYPAGETITQVFEAQATQTPDAVAVQFGEQELTYAPTQPSGEPTSPLP